MSTTNIDTPVSTAPSPAIRIAGRFLWKEYRMLRGLWHAVVGLTLAEQIVSPLLAAPGSDIRPWLLGSALAAAVLYAVGAAATLFAVEHEEETYNFLTGLPTTWLPVFAGKVLVVALSALALAITLTLTGLAVAGWLAPPSGWPTASDTRFLFSLLGLGIVEAMVWGTFFSLLVKRPLVAAMLALIVGTLSVQLAAIAVSQRSMGSADAAAYAVALPARVGIIACVFASATLLARRWLAVDWPMARTPTAPGFAAGLRNTFSCAIDPLRPESATCESLSRSRLFARLLWQTWRQSWRGLLLPVLVAAFLWFGVAAIAGFASGAEYLMLLIAPATMFLPALYGAIVFSGDQRRRQYRFLAEHAARPRYVWLARHLLWGGTPVVLFVMATLLAATAFGWLFHIHLSQYVEATNYQNYTSWEIGYAIRQPLNFFQVIAIFVGVGSVAALLAYAVGQLCSMLIRSEIMAAFLACVLSVFVTFWTALTLAWGLSVWWFVLPPALGLFAATWLRAPDWIAERNSWRRWWPVAAAVVVPAVGILAMIPMARLAQILDHLLRDAEDAVTPVRASYEAGDTAAARETAAMYLHAVDMFDDGATVGALDQFIAASQRPTCRLQFNLRFAPLRNSYPSTEELEKFRARLDPIYLRLIRLTTQLAIGSPPNDRALDWYLAGLRATAHLRRGQPTLVFVDQLSMETGLLRRIVEWATRTAPAEGEIRNAIEELQAHFAALPDPAEALIADDNLVRDVLVGSEPPLVFAHPPIHFYTHVAYLLHQLPWERELALRQLDCRTGSSIRAMIRTAQFLRDGQNDKSRSNSYYDFRAELARISRSGDRSPMWDLYGSVSVTLADLEYRALVQSDALRLALAEAEVQRRATLIQLALVLYRRDHDNYPESLVELAPEYLNDVPLDPYSGKPFIYLREGADLPVLDALATGDPIPPHTPFFWSVGPQNFAKLVRIEDQREERDPDNDDAKIVYVRRKASYRFWRDDFGWYWGSISLVFPLPK